MRDLHCHVLPGVDDGAPDEETSLRMLRRGLDDGTQTAVLTPHLLPEDAVEKCALHLQRFDFLRAAAHRAGLAVELHLGAEIRFRFGLADLAQDPSARLAGGPYVLVDLPFGSGPLESGVENGFFELRAAGYRPILAHPERHPQLFSGSDLLPRLRRQELLFQINGGSLYGAFGRRAQAAAEGLMERGWVEAIASDGHDLERRPFTLRQAREAVQSRWGADEARRLFEENPRRILAGEPTLRCDRPRPRRRPGLLQRLLPWRNA